MVDFRLGQDIKGLGKAGQEVVEIKLGDVCQSSNHRAAWLDQLAPHNGAGAGMAPEDAYILSNLLGSVQKASEIEKAFKAYDFVRRHRTQKLVTSSRKAGKVYDFEGDGVGDDLDAMRRNLRTRSNWTGRRAWRRIWMRQWV